MNATVGRSAVRRYGLVLAAGLFGVVASMAAISAYGQTSSKAPASMAADLDWTGGGPERPLGRVSLPDRATRRAMGLDRVSPPPRALDAEEPRAAIVAGAPHEVPSASANSSARSTIPAAQNPAAGTSAPHAESQPARPQTSLQHLIDALVRDLSAPAVDSVGKPDGTGQRPKFGPTITPEQVALQLFVARPEAASATKRKPAILAGVADTVAISEPHDQAPRGAEPNREVVEEEPVVPAVQQEQADRQRQPEVGENQQERREPQPDRRPAPRQDSRPADEPQENQEEQSAQDRPAQDRGAQDRPAADRPADRATVPIPQRLQQPQQASKTIDASIEDIVKNLDPELLAKLAGADVTVEMVGDQLILQGPEDAVRVIELLIRQLNEGREDKVVQVVTVTERDGNEVARTIQDSVNKVFKHPTRRPEDDVVINALSSNVLLVAALPTEIEFVVELIKEVDSVPDPLGKIELMNFTVKNRKASEVAKELEDFIKKYREVRGAKEKFQIKANNANNTIIVTARESERETFQDIIDQFDVAPTQGFGELKMVIFPLIHSKADDLAKVIENLIKTQASGGGERAAIEELILRLQLTRVMPDGQTTEMDPLDLQKNIKIIPDAGTNALIVATSAENVGPMGDLIRVLDGVPLGAEVSVRVFPLRFAAADTTEETLRKMFDDGQKLTEDPDGSGQDAVPDEADGKALVYNIGLASDERTNTLIVSGRTEQLDLAAKIIDQLDRPATGLKFPLKLIRLEYTDATQLGKTIEELFTKREESASAVGMTGAALEREKVFLSVDIPTNSLIVSASDENFEEITAIAKQLDAKPGRLFEQVRILSAGKLGAQDLKEKIDELWKRKADLRRESEMLEDLPVVVADERSNSLIVASSLEDFEEIERLVESLKARPMVGETDLFKLEHADANVLAGMLEELFQGIASQLETFKEPTIIPDSRSNSLIVAAAQDGMERVSSIIKRLDVEAGPLTSIFKVYPLSNASSGQLSQRIQELFDSRQEGQEQQTTPVVIMPDEASNSLVVSASRDDHAILVGLLELLDRPSTLARNVRIFPLRLARAAQVAEKLESLFQSQAEGGTGRADAIAIEADERTNSIIVWASPSQMINVSEVVERLDTATPAREMMVRVIQLKQALAEDFAQLLKDTMIGEGGEDEQALIISFMERNGEGQEEMRRLLRQDITVTPDPRTNSLMIMAPADSMAMLESMIEDFDRIPPVTNEIRLFPLINSDAETMVEKMEELFNPEGGGAEGEVRQQLVFGTAGEQDLAAIGQELRFASDARTNTLIVAGAPVYLRMVEDLVRYLDSQEAEDRVTEVYVSKVRDANELATAVKNFVQQEIDALGDGEDQESRMRRMERQVSIEAIGDPESGSSGLVVGTSRRAYQRTMELIQGLDRPEPQVMISVLIAEVSLNDAVDLGVEIAGQDLTFSEGAVVGPNGIIQGADFDVVGGSSLGAAGPLGFSFTVTGEDFNFLFHALQTDNRIEVLSRPILMVRNGEEGNITIADQVPVVTSSQITESGQTNVTPGREDVGIVLTATPHISPDGYVTIELKQEISNIGGEVQLSEDLSQPIFSTREVTTNVTVRDGETVVIGGLIQSRDSETETKVPLLGDLPYLGFMFRSTSVDQNKTELLVVLTVDILRTDEDVRRMSIEQRDKFVLPDTIRTSPLMEGLRIRPEEQGLGPRQELHRGQDAPPVRTPDDQQFGPKPKTYGPKIEPSTPATTTTASARVYGPQIPRDRIPAAAEP